ncbi:hypothetical protein Cpin_6370 [Chitinophaga pinensis DSM 2588]|uniref:Lipoprotein n=2 Tax=Chitinophaga pinensis TaxID=79329 RepID=A0A979GA73_CHIPD|nr:hypothetical protein Cpin_6370 [Chitinophaga pinensis DSM 2588]
MRRMRRICLPILLAVTVSCSTTKLAVPDQFSSVSTRYPVKGAQGWMVNQHLSFGDYSTSRIKRGWHIKSSVRYNNVWIPAPEVLGNIFGAEMMEEGKHEKAKIRYTLTNTHNSAEIFGSEFYDSHDVVLNAGRIPVIGGEYSTLLNSSYIYTAAIVPNDTSGTGLWSLLMARNYDIRKDTSHRIFDAPYVEEEGYATNGRDTVKIRTLNLNTFMNKNGKVSNTLLGARILSGYELSTEDGVVGIIDSMDKAIWLYNDQEEKLKFILSAMGTAILLKQIERQ